MSDTRLLSPWQRNTLLASVALSALGYVLFSLWSGWHEVSQAVATIGIYGIVIALLMSLVNYALRFLRWQLYLKQLGHAPPLLPSLRIYIAGFALTTTPGKAGEALRSVLLKRWRVPYPDSLGALLSERLSDLIAAVILTLAGLTLYPPARPMIFIGIGLVLAALVVISQQRLLEKLAAFFARHPSRPGQALHHACVMLLQARRCNSPGMLVLATSLSVMAWGAEALAFHWMLHWLGMDVSLAFSLFVYMIAMIAGALSFMPGGLGGAEATMTALLMWKGMPGAEAVAVTILIRLATLWFAVLLGGLCLLGGEQKKHQ